SKLTSSIRRSAASLQRKPCRYIIRNSKWSRAPFRPAFAASRKVLISVGSRKSFRRCGSVTLLSTLPVTARSLIGLLSFDYVGVSIGHYQLNTDNVQWQTL